MDSIELICEVCGTSNPPGTEFCTNCNSYLAWDRSAAAKPAGPSSKPTPTPTSTTSTVIQPQDWADATPTATYPDPSLAAQTQTQTAYAGQDPDAEPGYADVSCPNCGQVNPGTRRFCIHCGYAFYPGQPTDGYAGAWSAADLAAYDRQARRDYRRSLPAIYRWRRALIAILLVALVTAAVVVLHRDPVGVVAGAWYGLTKTYVPVDGVQVVVEPADAVVPPTTPAALVDRSVQEFSMRWAPAGESTCDPAPGTATILLTFPATRVRLLQVVPGLDQSNPQRALQPLPRVLGVRFDDNATCIPVPLTNAATQEPVKIDSKVPVTRMRIGIAAAYPAGPDAQPVISITELLVKAYPR